MNTKERTKDFLEWLINEIEKNGLMQYDIIHNGRHDVLDDAKDLLNLIMDEEKSREKRVAENGELEFASAFPWYVEKRKDQNYLTVIKDSIDRAICVMCIGMRNKTDIAHFIEAAPDMYEALQKIQEVELAIAQEHRVQAEDSEIYCIAEKALRKARVESEENHD